MKTVIEHALALAGRGLPVFPCRQDKKPYIKGGFHNASTDSDAIRAWWEKFPDALIGVPVGLKTSDKPTNAIRHASSTTALRSTGRMAMSNMIDLVGGVHVKPARSFAGKPGSGLSSPGGLDQQYVAFSDGHLSGM
jgi:hypothetical protein